eukprot:208303_1
MACTLPCCGTFCCFTSFICAIMQFVFYALINSNSDRIEIGDSEEDRNNYAPTALYTAIIYVVLIIISVFCMFSGGKKKRFGVDGDVPSDEEESTHLINDKDQTITYESTGAKNNKQ